MNFSELFKHTGRLVAFSPNGFYLSNSSQYRLIVRAVKSLQVLHMFNCVDTIQDAKWSPDSQFVLCIMKKRGIVQVWSMEFPDWTCKIDEGSAGLLTACWGPDSRHILTTADFHLRITLWSLSDKSVSYMKHPKACSQNLSFSPGGKYLALAERRNFKDHISILDCSAWNLVRHFPAETEDLDGIAWSPDGRVLAAWESSLRYGVVLYGVDGRRLHSFSAYDITGCVLGVKTVAWSPTGQFLAIGSYDQKCRLLNHINWGCLVELSHPLDRAVDPTEGVVIYREVAATGPRGLPDQARYEVVQEPMKVPHVKPDPTRANPKVGVGLVQFSPDNRFLATRNDQQPCAVWIWEVARLSLVAVLVQEAPVRAIAWDPVGRGRLGLCTGADRVFMWSPQGCLAVQVPSQAGFHIHNIAWQPSGDALLLLSESDFCLCFLDDSEEGRAGGALSPPPKVVGARGDQ